MALVAVIDDAGITAPTYEEILDDLMQRFKLLFGMDAYVDPDAQDMQMLAIFAEAVRDANDMAVAVYQSFSPSTARGVGLSSVVKINGLRRKTATFSTVPVTLIGQAGTIISNGAVSDTQNNTWLLPTLVTIPVSGEVTVGATALNAGAVTAAIGTVTHILTSHPGWQEVTNHAAASPGAPVEMDADLRIRQAQSTALSAQSPTTAILAGVLNLPGVTRARIYDNDTDAPDINGVPAHSIAVVVEGGDATAIAETIAWTKSPGTGVYGTTTVTVYDPHGVPNTVNFFYLQEVPVYVQIHIQPLTGYLATIGDQITASVVRYLNDLEIGEKVYHNRLWAPASLQGEAAMLATGMSQADLDGLSETFTVLAITMSLADEGYRALDLAIPFDGAAIATTDTVALTLPAVSPSAVTPAAAAPGGRVHPGLRVRPPGPPLSGPPLGRQG